MVDAYSGKSQVVAIAGAKGGAGQHVTEALLAAGFQVILLLRKKTSDLIHELTSFIPESKTADVLIAEVVDFNQQEVLTSAFEKYNVDTVISALFLPNPGEWEVEENLLNAAVKAGVRRFAPSNFAGPVEDSHSMRSYEFKRRIMTLVSDAPISYTHFTTGIFMNYFASNAPAQEGDSPMGHLRNMSFVVDIEKDTALIPGTGDTVVAFTEIHDVGRGVVAACSLEGTWTPRTGWMAGDLLSYNEVVKIAEEVKGRKFGIKHLSIAELDELCVPKDDNIMSTFFFEAMRALVTPSTKGGLDHLSGSLKNESKEALFRPIGVREFIGKWWRSVL